MHKCFCIIWFTLFSGFAFSQEKGQQSNIELNADTLINWLYQMQSDGKSFYDAGLFPSQRIHPVLSYHKEDNNIFFTALITLILQDVAPHLSDKSEKKAKDMIQEAVSNYPKYRNKDGGPTYNFWQTDPPQHFPNDKILSIFKKFMLPDDFDDTSIIFLTDEKSAEKVSKLKEEMKLHANNNKLSVENTFDRYRDINAYSTWFGENMPIDFDIAVLANTMSMVYAYNLPLNRYDSSSLYLIDRMLEDNEHIKNPDYISPHYKKTAVIMYHMARLIGAYNPLIVSDQKDELILEINRELSQTESLMEYILLTTSMMKLGLCPPQINKELVNDIGEYNFFVANMVSTMKDPWKKMLGATNLLAFPYNCLAYDYALVLENMVYRKIKKCPGMKLVTKP